MEKNNNVNNKHHNQICIVLSREKESKTMVHVQKNSATAMIQIIMQTWYYHSTKSFLLSCT